MADFTKDLGLASSSRRIIDPANNKGPTFLEGLANFAGNVVSQGSDTFRRAQATSRQQAADAKKAAEDQTSSDAAGFVIDARLGKFQTGPSQAQPEQPSLPVALSDDLPVPVDSELEGAPLPPDVTRVVGDLRRAQAAEDQGRAPMGSAQIRIEAALADIRARHPDRQDIIYKTLKDAGLDHWLFREAETSKAVFDAEIKAETDMFQTFVQAAVKAGAVLPGTDPYTAAAAGQRILEEDRRLEVLKQQRDANLAAAAEGRAQSNFDRGELDRNFTGTYTSKADSIVTPLYNGLVSRITSAGFTDSQGNIQSLDRVIPVAQQSINQIYDNLISEAQANGAPRETVMALQQDRENKIKSINEMLTGDASTFAVRKRAVDSLQSELKLSAMEALPVYSGLVQIFGQGAVNDMNGLPLLNALPPEVKQELMGELRNVRGVIDTDQEKLTMAKLAGVLRGDLQIQNMTEREAQQAVPVLGQTHRSNAAGVATGTGNVDAYVNSGFNLASAAVELQPGMDRSMFGRNVPVAQQLLFDGPQVRADEAIMRQDPQKGLTLIQGKRAAATHTLNLSRNTAIAPNLAEQGWRIQYQTSGPRAGTYQAVLNQAAYNTYRNKAIGQASSMSAAAGGVGISQAVIPTYEQALANPNRQMQSQVGGMNLALNYLVSTSKYDDEFKGISPAEQRRFFALGEVPQAFANRAAPSASEATNNFETIDNQLIQGFTEAAAQSAQRSAVERQSAPARQVIDQGLNFFTQQGWSPAQAAGILGNLQAESGFSTTVTGDGGKAVGLAQWHPDRRRTAQQQGFDLTDMNQALAFVNWELNNTESAAGRRLRAAQTAKEAADIFAQYFLRPAGAQTGNPDNIHNISGRRQNAQRIFGAG